MRAVLCLSALLLVSVPAYAQSPNVSIVPYAGFNVDAEELFFAGGLGIPIPAARIANHAIIVQPSFEIYPFIDNATLWAIAAHLIIPFPLQTTSAVVPYAMGGFSIARVSVDLGALGSVSDTEPFFDFGGGVAFGASMFRTHPFVEVDVRVGDGSTVLFKGGVRIATKR
jgi:hypothetical protein